MGCGASKKQHETEQVLAEANEVEKKKEEETEGEQEKWQKVLRMLESLPVWVEGEEFKQILDDKFDEIDSEGKGVISESEVWTAGFSLGEAVSLELVNAQKRERVSDNVLEQFHKGVPLDPQKTEHSKKVMQTGMNSHSDLTEKGFTKDIFTSVYIYYYKSTFDAFIVGVRMAVDGDSEEEAAERAKQFLAGMLQFLESEALIIEVKSIFTEEDKDHNKELEVSEMFGALQQCYDMLGRTYKEFFTYTMGEEKGRALFSSIALPTPTEAMVEAVLQEFDYDNSGTIDVDEFVGLVKAMVKAQAQDLASGTAKLATAHK